MAKTIILRSRLTKVVSHYKKYDLEVPKKLLEIKSKAPDLSDFPYPLPQKKSDYTCFCEAENGVMWYGADGGVTRYDKDADMLADVVMYFSAPRDLQDNRVSAIEADGNGVWVLTENGVTHIDMVEMTMEEKANRLLDETLTYVSRHSMVSDRHLSEAGNLKSAVPYGHSDNDGGFTACFALGEIFKYATYKREKGELDEATIKAREVAMRASEAALLLMFIPGRGDGFVARSYVTTDEPVPDDGLFYRKQGDKAVCLNTSASRKKNMVGLEIPCGAPIPERLRKLYTEDGYSDDDVIYKGDTSSDEITLHYIHILAAHEFLGREDPEYDEILKTAAVNTMAHIIDNGFALRECNGQPTTWAKWNQEYFETPMGWADACLNSAEVLMYLLVTMHVTGEKGRWQEAFDELEKKGYVDLMLHHFDRFHQESLAAGCDDREEIMYGDFALATMSFWGLTSIDKNEERLKKYRAGYKTWRNVIGPEFNAGYDFIYQLSCPDDDILDEERIKTWFYRFGASRLASAVSLDIRKDIPQKILFGGYRETSALLPNDERFIAKYDRNPFEYKNEDSGGSHTVESCYPFTFAYWIGRYFGFIKEG